MFDAALFAKDLSKLPQDPSLYLRIVAKRSFFIPTDCHLLKSCIRWFQLVLKALNNLHIPETSHSYLSNAGDGCIELPSKGSCSESLKISSSSHVASSCCVQHCLSEPISRYSYFSPSWDYMKVMHLQCQESKLCSGVSFSGKNQIYAHWFFLSCDTQMAGSCRLRKWSGSSTTTLVPLSNSRPVFAIAT